MGYDDKSLEEIAAQLRSGGTSVRELIDASATRHAERNLGAYKTWSGETASATAGSIDWLLKDGYDTGPLMGLPCSVKDLYGVPGLPVFAGTDAQFPDAWQRPGPVVSRLMGQLGVIMGKTHTVEMAFGGIGMNPHWPVPVNPWGGGGRIPGGSSSGAGVSLVEGSALIALGTDTAGSVRIPASVTGNVGLKITYGRWSCDGIVPLSSSFDTPGVLCRSVDDLRFVFGALDPAARPVEARPSVSGLRIGLLDGALAEGVDPDIAELVSGALRRMEGDGLILKGADLPQAEPALALFRKGGLAASELAAFLQADMPESITRLDPLVKARVDAAEGLSATDYLIRRQEFARLQAETAATAFKDFDFLACATVAISPPRLTDLGLPETYGAANMQVLRNTAVANLLGLCAITIPVGLDGNDMPVGLMLMAPPLQEERLIAAALGFEQRLGKGRDLLGTAPPIERTKREILS